MPPINNDEIFQAFIEESSEHLGDIDNELLEIEKQGENVDAVLLDKVFRAIHSIKGGANFLGLEIINKLAHHMEHVFNLIKNKEIIPTTKVMDVLLRATDLLKNLIDNVGKSETFDISEQVIEIKNLFKDKRRVRVGNKSDVSSLIKQTTAESKKVFLSESSLRVKVNIIDDLMNLASELVLSRNQLIQAVDLRDEKYLASTASRINLITSDLREAIMKIRMQPLQNIFSKYPRISRDLARELGKEIDLVIEGEDVELDKTIIESIIDPLTHLIRNAIDHGIEYPEERKKKGKPFKGLIQVRAYHAAGQVNIEIADDGNGIDIGLVKKKAVLRKIITVDQAKGMSRQEVYNLLFLPGFTTVDVVTSLSGRGVGMDVVKNNIENLGGVIEIDSTFEERTIVTLKLPLTLAIIPCLLVFAGREMFALPQVNLVEVVRIVPDQVKHRIEKIGTAEVLRLRDNLLPLVRLRDVLGIHHKVLHPETGKMILDRRDNVADRRNPFAEKENKSKNRRIKRERRFHAVSSTNIVIVQVGRVQYGLIVDGLSESKEIVVKPLGKYLKGCPCYSGTTILGDGMVSLILDISGIARYSQIGTIQTGKIFEEIKKEMEEGWGMDKQSLLLFLNGKGEEFAVPLHMVSRIEKITADQVEKIGDEFSMQYQGRTLPLLSIERVAKIEPKEKQAKYQVIVFQLGAKEVGLWVSQVIDIVDIEVVIDDETLKQPGIAGSTIIQGKTILIVDIYGIIDALHPEWFKARERLPLKDKGKHEILLVESSLFLRKQMQEFLELEGYKVFCAEGAASALELLREGKSKAELIIAALNIPDMGGFKFVEDIRKIEGFKNIPVFALTSLTKKEDVEKGKSLGISESYIKLDREAILAAIARYFRKKGKKEL